MSTDELKDYEEYHETRQSILQSEQEDTICPYGNRANCKWLHCSSFREEWGIEWEFECHHPKSVSEDCPLREEEEEESKIETYIKKLHTTESLKEEE